VDSSETDHSFLSPTAEVSLKPLAGCGALPQIKLGRRLDRRAVRQNYQPVGFD